MNRFAILLSLVFALAPLRASAEDTFKVTNAGTGTKTALRYAFKKGQKVKGKVESDMSMAMTIGAQSMPKADMPTVTQDMTLTVDSVDAAGNLQLTGVITKLTVSKKGEAQVVKAMEEQLKLLTGSKYIVTMTNRGALTGARYELPAGAPAQLQETIEGVVNGLKQLLPLLPEEPVGVGAEWTSHQKLKISFAQADQDATFKLKSKKGDTCELEVTVAQKAGKQKISLPGMPPGQSAELGGLTGNASGKTKVSLAKPSLAAEVKSDIAMQISAQGQAMNMEMGLVQRFKL